MVSVVMASAVSSSFVEGQAASSAGEEGRPLSSGGKMRLGHNPDGWGPDLFERG